ncbi:MAG: HD domain-containing protein [Sphaerochaetaceae bacterium]|nr:HD domain-containing protein [Sphaerochaetaceae bacterium]
MGEKRFINHLDKEILTKRVYERKDDLRSPFYRDTTAIIHSSPFRRLKHKTQVFFAPSNDHICTRIEHVLHVASIASAICQQLSLDTDLAWAIGMGHDLGHTPFGHVGEKIIDDIMTDRIALHFEHEMNSLRVIDFLADNGKGLNLTYAVRDGIASHNGETFLQSIKPTHSEKDLNAVTGRKGIVPSTWESVVVRFSDQIAYVGRDFEDACRLNVIQKDMLPENVRRVLGDRNSKIIDTLVHDIICTSNSEKGITFSDEVYEALVEMKEFNYRQIYRSPMLKGYFDYFSRLLHLIVDYLEHLFGTYGFDFDLYQKEKNMLSMGFVNYLKDMKEAYRRTDGGYSRVVFDYVAGMSDNFALDCADEILKPTHLNEDIERSLTGKWFDVR